MQGRKEGTEEERGPIQPPIEMPQDEISLDDVLQKWLGEKEEIEPAFDKEPKKETAKPIPTPVLPVEEKKPIADSIIKSSEIRDTEEEREVRFDLEQAIIYSEILNRKYF